MTTSPRFGFDFISVNQSQKEVTANEFAELFDIIVGGTIKGVVGSNTPPSQPNNGDLYLTGLSSEGAWVNQNLKIAFYNTGWKFFNIPTNLIMFVEELNSFGKWNGTNFDTVLAQNMPSIITNDFVLQNINNNNILEFDSSSGNIQIFLPYPSTLIRGFTFSILKSVVANNLKIIPPRKNLIDDSEDLSAWSSSRFTVSTNEISFPDGSATADKFMETNESGIHEMRKNFVVNSSDTSLNLAIKVKLVGSSEKIVLFCDDGGSSNRTKVRFNILNTSVEFSDDNGTFSSSNASITPLVDNWHLLFFTVNKSSETNLTLRLRGYNNSETYTGDINNGWYAGQAQIYAYNTAVIMPYIKSELLSANMQINGSDELTLTTQHTSIKILGNGDNIWYEL